MINKKTEILNIKTKKAAMFGLDARIALAIFAALSVITGAALYSAIQKTKVIAIITTMQEIGKAWESYYLDTSTNLAKRDSSNPAASNYYILKAGHLVTDPSINGWKGPYLSYTSSVDYALDNSKYSSSKIYLKVLSHEDSWNDWNGGLCTSTKKCSLWIHTDNVKESIDFIKQIDKSVDNSDGLSNGSFRWVDGGGVFDILLRVNPIKNPND